VRDELAGVGWAGDVLSTFVLANERLGGRARSSFALVYL